MLDGAGLCCDTGAAAAGDCEAGVTLKSVAFPHERRQSVGCAGAASGVGFAVVLVVAELVVAVLTVFVLVIEGIG